MKSNTNQHKFKKVFLSLLVAGLFLLPSVSYAATRLPCTPSSQGAGNNDLITCINNLYRYALIISSIAAVMMIIFAGYMYIFSGGSDKKVSAAKSWISTSLLGIAVLLTGFLLLKQINPNLLTIRNISPQTLSQQEWFYGGNGNITTGSRDNNTSSPISATSQKTTAGNVQGNGVTCNGGKDVKPSLHVSCTCFSAEVKAAASEFGVDAALIRAVLYQETECGRVNRTSSKGAQGAMQILPGTAQGVGCPANWATDNAANIRCGAKVLKTYSNQYGKYGMESVLAAYNGGGNALRASQDCPGLQRYQCAFDNADHSVCNAGPGTYEETRNYVATASRFYNEAKACN